MIHILDVDPESILGLDNITFSTTHKYFSNIGIIKLLSHYKGRLNKTQNSVFFYHVQYFASQHNAIMIEDLWVYCDYFENMSGIGNKASEFIEYLEKVLGDKLHKTSIKLIMTGFVNYYKRNQKIIEFKQKCDECNGIIKL